VNISQEFSARFLVLFILLITSWREQNICIFELDLFTLHLVLNSLQGNSEIGLGQAAFSDNASAMGHLPPGY
jgi:hypothetical protein